MILMVNAMPFSDRLLLQYLRSKDNHLSGIHLLYERIAVETGMSRATVQRAMCRMERAGLITRLPGVGKSYIYKVNHEQQSA